MSSAESDLTWTKGIEDHGRSVREDEAQSNGEPTLPPFALNVQGSVSSQLASEVFDSFDEAVPDVTVQDIATSSADRVDVAQGGSSSSAQASLVRRQPFSLKRARQRGVTPPLSLPLQLPGKRKNRIDSAPPEGAAAFFLLQGAAACLLFIKKHLSFLTKGSRLGQGAVCLAPPPAAALGRGGATKKASPGWGSRKPPTTSSPR